jgi:hypothetical protein
MVTLSALEKQSVLSAKVNLIMQSGMAVSEQRKGRAEDDDIWYLD